MGDSETSFCLSSLLCREDESWLNEQGGEEKGEEKSYLEAKSPNFVSENEEEYVENLFKKESFCFGSKGFVAFDDCSIISESWLKSARLDAIKWIFNTRAVFGFHFRTAYLSITYFDRFLSKVHIDSEKIWAIQLLSVACLSLGAKMEECNVPVLSEFPVQNYYFESKVIQRMELKVLTTLDWKLSSITPFAYLYYFINKLFGESRPKVLVSSAVELIGAITKEINLMDSRPSVIAAAAVLAASTDQLTRKDLELKMSVISSWRAEDNEHIYSCYNLMQDIERRKVKTPELVVSPIVFENSSFISAEGTKRRLTFDVYDQTTPIKKIHRT